MSSKLLEYTKDFKSSQPVFKLSIKQTYNDNKIIDASVVERYAPMPIAGDPLSEVVCQSYTESFRREYGEYTFKFDSNEIVTKAIYTIRERMTKFVSNNLAMKNPKQSKLYKYMWKKLPRTTTVDDGLILLYKYIKPYCDENMRIKAQEFEQHRNNTIALLEALMEKTDEK